MYIARPCAHCSDNTDLGDMDDLGCSTPSSSTLSTHESSLSSSAELADVESDFTQPRAGEQQVFNMLDYIPIRHQHLPEKGKLLLTLLEV